MSLPITGDLALMLAVVFGAAFGFLLQRGRVTYYDVIVNQFRFRDFTVLKVMLTAVLVGGIGVLLLHKVGLADYHIKPANLVAVAVGAIIFGVGMVLYGYCPGTAVAAIGQGSLHALAGFVGMLVGGIMYALSYGWLKQHVLGLADLGKVRLPELTGISDEWWFLVLALVVGVTFLLVERFEKGKAY